MSYEKCAECDGTGEVVYPGCACDESGEYPPCMIGCAACESTGKAGYRQDMEDVIEQAIRVFGFQARVVALTNGFVVHIEVKGRKFELNVGGTKIQSLGASMLQVASAPTVPALLAAMTALPSLCRDKCQECNGTGATNVVEYEWVNTPDNCPYMKQCDACCKTGIAAFKPLAAK